MNPPPNEKRYRTFRAYLREKYGCSVRKLLIHSALNCPNRNDDYSGGCIYCNNNAFYPYSLSKIPVRQQIAAQMSRYRNNGRAQKFIAYFQTYTNTNAPVDRLKRLYDEILDFPDIVGLAIGTRPDCIDHEILDLISTYADQREVWIEYGLQSAQNRSLKQLNRGHTVQDYTCAVEKTRNYPISVCTHLILGIPGESLEEILNTVRLVVDSGIEGVKFHPLQVIRDTELEAMYNRGEVPLLTEEVYVDWLIECIERLPPSVIVQRVTADAAGDYLVAPDWCRDKMQVIRHIDIEMQRRDAKQGHKTGTWNV